MIHPCLRGGEEEKIGKGKRNKKHKQIEQKNIRKRKNKKQHLCSY